MNKNEFIAKLQMVYVGDTNALGELTNAYVDLQRQLEEKDKIINETIKYINNTIVAEYSSEEIINIHEFWFVKKIRIFYFLKSKFYAISEMNAIEIYNILCKELNFNTMIELHKLILHKMTYLEDKPINYCEPSKGSEIK